MSAARPRWWILAGAGLVVAAALWSLLDTGHSPLPGAVAQRTGQAAPDAVADDADPVPVAAAGAPAAALAPPVDRPGLARWLASRNLDADRLIDGWQAWRQARGLFDESGLTGVDRTDSIADRYARMDDASLAQMAEAGDLAALQEQAERLAAVDSMGALSKYIAAAQRGSAAAMFGASRTLLAVAALQGEDTSADPELNATLREWRNMDGSTDIRQEALAWALAAVRTDGAAVLEGSRLAEIEALARQLDQDQLRMACAESLAYFGGYRGMDGGTGLRRGKPPPVFVTERDVYQRLPCGDTAAPITPPRPMQACQELPAAAGGNQPASVWICPEN